MENSGSIKLKHKVEAILFLSESALSAIAIARQLEVETNLVREALSKLIQEYEERDSALMIDSENGYLMRIKEEFNSLAETVLPFEMKTACLRTLSTVALKEPIRQSEIIELRGSGAYEHLKELVKLGLIRKRKEGITNVVTTSREFAKYFKLSNNGLELQKELKTAENVRITR
jgi:segregation and condensation protein B